MVCQLLSKDDICLSNAVTDSIGWDWKVCNVVYGNRSDIMKCFATVGYQRNSSSSSHKRKENLEQVCRTWTEIYPFFFFAREKQLGSKTLLRGMPL